VNDFARNLQPYVGSQFDTSAEITHPNFLNNYTVFQWGYNGQFPGPVIEITQGDRLQIILKNELPQATSLHLHGITQDWESDGAGGVSEVPLQPGVSRTYDVGVVNQCGTFFYSSGYQGWRQNMRQMMGMLVVHCTNEEPVNQDYAIMAHAWNILADRDARNCPAWWRATYDWYMFNGRSSPSIPALKARAGEKVRIRFVNPTQRHSYPIYLHGHSPAVSQMDGQYVDVNKRNTVSTVVLPAGVSVDVTFIARPGVWPLQSVIAEQTVNFLIGATAAGSSPLTHPGGMSTLLCVEGVTSKNSTIKCY
jgi:FtsP/CotA-like multicopper oxidase with cupredoxin domain